MSFRGPYLQWQCQCPHPGNPTIRLEREVWHTHILVRRPYLASLLGQVGDVVTAPDHILRGSQTAGSANPNYKLLVNTSVVTPGMTPLCVVIDPNSRLVRSVYHNRSLRGVLHLHPDMEWRR